MSVKTKDLIKKLKLKTGTEFIGKINNHRFIIRKIYNETYGTESGKIRTKKSKTVEIEDIKSKKRFEIGLDMLAHCAITVI